MNHLNAHKITLFTKNIETLTKKYCQIELSINLQNTLIILILY